MDNDTKMDLAPVDGSVAERADRPLVTFALFAYNQEKYIREAVEGAFAQTYEPLEIILSDDCSTDRTFEIMQEMAAAYKGPHKVQALKQSKNLGIVDHVITVARIAEGVFFVVAAGDDISYPNRVEELTKMWQSTGATALVSRHDEISEGGTILKENHLFPTDLPGFCASYKTRFWSALPLTGGALLAEDGLAFWIIKIRHEKIARVNKPLMAYRIVRSSLSPRGEPISRTSIWHREAKINNAAKELKSRVKYLVLNAYTASHPINEDHFTFLTSDWNYARVMEDFWEKSFWERFCRIRICREKREISYVMPRIFGTNVFQTSRIVLSLTRNFPSRLK